MSSELRVRLIPDARRALSETSALLGLSETDVVNRALQVYAFIESETASGGEHLIRNADGDMLKVNIA